MSKNYDINSIYFGSIVYFAENDGYYHTNPVALQKTEEDFYTELGKGTLMKNYKEGTTDLLTVTNVVPLSSLTNNRNEKEISENKIKLYLLKYCLDCKNKEVVLFSKSEENKNNVK